MLNRLKQYMITSILCVALLFTMGSDIGTRSNNDAEITANPTVLIEPEDQITDHNRPATILPNLVKEEHIIPLENRAPELQSVQTNTNYEVTAYYLNVRADANSKSKILDVVSKGTILEVIKPTDNGWLKLKSGGYVHSKYAKLISRGVKQPEHVKVLSVEKERPIQPTSLVKSDSGLTEEHIAKIFDGTALEGEGLEKAILNVEKDYGINSYFTIAVMKLESGHGKSRIAKHKNNLFGLNATGKDPYNKAFSFKTKGDSVQKFGHIISEYYVDKGLTSIDKVAPKYCGVNTNWSALVKSIMKSDYKKISKNISL